MKFLVLFSFVICAVASAETIDYREVSKYSGALPPSEASEKMAPQFFGADCARCQELQNHVTTHRNSPYGTLLEGQVAPGLGNTKSVK